MGTGASSGAAAEAAAPGASTLPQRTAVPAQGSAAISSSASTAVVDVVEGGVQWLASVVDREKQEKDWLAKQYEAKCQEVRALQQELATMKHELAETRRLAGLGVSSSHSVAGSGGKAAHALQSSSSSGSITHTEGNPTSPGNLMGRRGLALHIECEGKRRATIGSTHVELVSPVKDKTTPSNASHSDRTSPTSASTEKEVAEKPKADPWKNEPVSALLKRRSVRNAEFDPLPPNSDRPSGGKEKGEKEEAEKETPVSHVSSHHEAPPPSATERRNSDFDQGLRVQAGKVAVLEDFPASPKRVSLRRSQTGGAADFAGSGGTF